MIIKINGRLVGVYSEHCYVTSGIEFHYLNDTGANIRVGQFLQDVERLLSKNFYHNHITVLLQEDDNDIFIGVNDGIMTVGSRCHKLSDSEFIGVKDDTAENHVKFYYNND